MSEDQKKMETENSRVEINENLLKQLFDLYTDSLTEFLSYYTRNQAQIEDVIQEIFIRLWENRAELNIFYIKTYLFKSARNLMLNTLRNEENRNMLLEQWANELITESEAKDCINMHEFELLYKEAVEKLPSKCKDIYKLSREEKHSYKAIAQLRSISEKTVENQMSIALKKIKEFLLHNYSQKTVGYVIMITYMLNEMA